jgi:hypothetical protein
MGGKLQCRPRRYTAISHADHIARLTSYDAFCLHAFVYPVDSDVNVPISGALRLPGPARKNVIGAERLVRFSVLACAGVRVSTRFDRIHHPMVASTKPAITSSRGPYYTYSATATACTKKQNPQRTCPPEIFEEGYPDDHSSYDTAQERGKEGLGRGRG